MRHVVGEMVYMFFSMKDFQFEAQNENIYWYSDSCLFERRKAM